MSEQDFARTIEAEASVLGTRWAVEWMMGWVNAGWLERMAEDLADAAAEERARRAG